MSISGFLLVNKPSGPTSHDMVDQLRRLTGEKTIGHAGTLDPFATGLLIMGVGREATRRMLALTHLDKWYEAEIELGVETDTYDATGRVVRESGIRNQESETLFEVIKTFLGPQEQVPPMFSAKKIGGKKLYELARAGKEVERPTARVSIYRMELLDKQKFLPLEGGDKEGVFKTSHHPPLTPPLKGGESTGTTAGPALRFLIRASSGTYIRSLAHDLGEKLGCGAHLKELTRLAVGPFGLAQATDNQQLTANNWQEKILPIPQVLEILNNYKENPTVKLSAKKALSFGTFDPLHEGHHYFLTEAKKYGDHLTVVITRDAHIKHFKKREPKQSEKERLVAVQALPCVNEVRLSDEHLDWKCLKEVKPDVIVLGHDQSELKAALQKQTTTPLIQLREMVV